MAELTKERMTSTIFIKTQGRPCWLYEVYRGAEGVRDVEKRQRAFLHVITTRAVVIDASPLKGGHPGGQVSRPVAVVETENGSLREVELWQVQLLDTTEQLKENEAVWTITQE